MAARWASPASGCGHVEDLLARWDVNLSLGDGDVIFEISRRRPCSTGAVDCRRDLGEANAAPPGERSQERACSFDESNDERPVLETHIVDGLEVVRPFLHGDVGIGGLLELF